MEWGGRVERGRVLRQRQVHVGGAVSRDLWFVKVPDSTVLLTVPILQA